MRNYANAKDVLPEDLYRRIREHFSGGILYFPGKPIGNNGKKQIAISLYEQGTSIPEIAGIMGVTTRRVNQLLVGRQRRKTAKPPSASP